MSIAFRFNRKFANACFVMRKEDRCTLRKKLLSEMWSLIILSKLTGLLTQSFFYSIPQSNLLLQCFPDINYIACHKWELRQVYICVFDEKLSILNLLTYITCYDTIIVTQYRWGCLTMTKTIYTGLYNYWYMSGFKARFKTDISRWGITNHATILPGEGY